MKNPKPIKNFVLVEQVEKKANYGLETVSSNESERKLEMAKVLAIGPDVTQEIEVGDTVIFKSYNLFVVELPGKKEFCFLQDDEILAIQ